MALVDQDRIGLGITVFVSIETGDHSQEWLERFAKVVGAMPEVMEFYRMAGDVDYMLRVVVSDMAGYDAFYKTTDRGGAAEERHLAFRHGEDQVDDGAADSGVSSPSWPGVKRRPRRPPARCGVADLLERIKRPAKVPSKSRRRCRPARPGPNIPACSCRFAA